MARTSKPLLDVDAASAELLSDRVSASGKSLRELAAETGMSMNRIGIILRKQPPPATIGEIGLIARAVGSSASEIVEAAELRATRQSDLGLAARGRDEDRGEEIF